MRRPWNDHEVRARRGVSYETIEQPCKPHIGAATLGLGFDTRVGVRHTLTHHALGLRIHVMSSSDHTRIGARVRVRARSMTSMTREALLPTTWHSIFCSRVVQIVGLSCSVITNHKTGRYSWEVLIDNIQSSQSLISSLCTVQLTYQLLDDEGCTPISETRPQQFPYNGIYNAQSCWADYQALRSTAGLY